MSVKPPGGECHDLFGADCKGSPGHLRVLKPPGGGSSDIFGTAPVDQSPKRRTNYMQSSLFVEPESVNTTPARVKSGNDTHNRLFGEVTTKPVTPYSLKSKSNLGFGDELDNTPAANGKNIYSPRGDGTTTNGVKEASVANGNDNANETTNVNANVNNENTAASASAPAASAPAASTATSSPARAATAPQRSRVPPGGFSSGLW
ncbi:microtubule-associated protein Jupiter-like isoform X5 [Schistocerca gregaria]|uniref:microtubule-associated protein Jupiter-like isoform X5 n=1 Tax=Schistocerca gregaria TaxID=7010 RepID=UPI00211E1E64|nr:microtubule-associated protein Jupiter-like isoform X5 [Schistocerca gregaria]